jgi:hypothetical protein
MEIKIIPGKFTTIYHNGKDRKDKDFRSAEVFLHYFPNGSKSWNLNIYKCIDSRGLLSWKLVSKLDNRELVEKEAMVFMTTGNVKTEWCRGTAPNF